MIVPVMAISNLVLTQQIYSEETNGAHAHYREPVPLIHWSAFFHIVCGGVCGRAVNTLNSGSGGLGFKPRPSVVFLDRELYSTLSLITQVYKWVPETYC